MSIYLKLSNRLNTTARSSISLVQHAACVHCHSSIVDPIHLDNFLLHDCGYIPPCSISFMLEVYQARVGRAHRHDYVEWFVPKTLSSGLTSLHEFTYKWMKLLRLVSPQARLPDFFACASAALAVRVQMNWAFVNAIDGHIPSASALRLAWASSRSALIFWRRARSACASGVFPSECSYRVQSASTYLGTEMSVPSSNFLLLAASPVFPWLTPVRCRSM